MTTAFVTDQPTNQGGQFVRLIEALVFRCLVDLEHSMDSGGPVTCHNSEVQKDSVSVFEVKLQIVELE